MTAPQLATRDALAEVIHSELGTDRCDRDDVRLKPTCENLADAILASGILRAPATLADDAALVERVAHLGNPTLWRGGEEPWTTGRGGLQRNHLVDSRNALRALAAALTEDPSC